MKFSKRLMAVVFLFTLTSFACLISTPKQSGDVLFSDDFSNPTSGWDRVNETEYSTDYSNGAYRINVNGISSSALAKPGNRTFTDVHIEVDATKNGGPDDNDFGVICRYQDSTNFYLAVISSDGFYGIQKMTEGVPSVLGSNKLLPSDQIFQGEATNRIRFDCVGSTLTLYINGAQVDQQTDSEFTSGNVGLIAGTYEITGTDILFDNFYVYQP
jgi:hypothetical protein